MATRSPFLVRHRRAVTIGVLALLALFFAIHVHHWHAPYRLGGAAGEWPLLAAALTVGLVVRVALQFRGAGRDTDAAWPQAAIASLVAFLAVQAADPFAGGRDWRYAPEGCDFAVSFTRRPEIVTGQVRLGALPERRIARAVHIDLGRAVTLSAECLPFAAKLSESDAPAMLDAAETLLRQSGARLRLKIETVTRPGARTVVLTGYSDEGRNAANEMLIRRAEGRAIVGASSLLVVWAWAVGRDGQPPTDVGAFFAAIRPAAP